MLSCRAQQTIADLISDKHDLSTSYKQLKEQYTIAWEHLLAVHMLACDALHSSDGSGGSRPKYAVSPFTGKKVELTHNKVVQCRLFNLLDADSDGVISLADVGAWLKDLLTVGSVSYQGIQKQMLRAKGSHIEAVIDSPTHMQLFMWLQGRVWDLLREGFAPQSSHPSWQV